MNLNQLITVKKFENFFIFRKDLAIKSSIGRHQRTQLGFTQVEELLPIIPM